MIPISYLKKVNAKLVDQSKKKDIVPDSSGFSTKRCEACFDIKTNRHKSKKYYIKLHILIAIQSLAIIFFDVTKGTQDDTPILKKLLKDIPKGVGDFCADPAYLSRNIYNMVATLNKTS